MNLKVHAITVDSSDAARVARFWSAALERPVDPDAGEAFASIGMSDPGADPPGWLFNQVPEAKQVKNRVHVDLAAADLEAEVQRLVGLGAKRVADLEEAGTRWTTLTDPEGNEFDVVQLAGS